MKKLAILVALIVALVAVPSCDFIDHDLIPITDNTYNIGSATNRWHDGYFVDVIATGGVFENINVTTGNFTNIVADNITVNGASILEPSYGSLYEISEAGNNINVIISGTFYQWINTTVGIETGGNTVVGSAINDNIVVGSDGEGVYYISVSVSLGGSNNIVVQGAVFLNGVRQQGIEFNRKLNASGDAGSASISGLLDLSDGDQIDLRFTANGNNKLVTIEHCYLTMFRLGD